MDFVLRRGGKVTPYFVYGEPRQRSMRAKDLEGGFADAGDLALVRQLAEADTAYAVVTQIGVGTAADLAAVVLAGGELSRSLLLENHRFLSHFTYPPT